MEFRPSQILEAFESKSKLTAKMLSDGSDECVHSNVVGQTRISGDAPQARSVLDVSVEVVEEARHAEPEPLAATDELQDLYQRARSDQGRLPHLGVHRIRIALLEQIKESYRIINGAPEHRFEIP